jgi:hypothetical protein
MHGMISVHSLPELAQFQKSFYKPQVGLRRAGDACYVRFGPGFGNQLALFCAGTQPAT